MSYTYAGTRTGLDSFDAAEQERPLSKGNLKAAVDAYLHAERESQFAYWYARDLNDKEISSIVRCGDSTVGQWRRRRGLPPNV